MQIGCLEVKSRLLRYKEQALHRQSGWMLIFSTLDVFHTDFSVERYIFDISDFIIVQNDVDWQPFSQQ